MNAVHPNPIQNIKVKNSFKMTHRQTQTLKISQRNQRNLIHRGNIRLTFRSEIELFEIFEVMNRATRNLKVSPELPCWPVHRMRKRHPPKEPLPVQMTKKSSPRRMMKRLLKSGQSLIQDSVIQIREIRSEFKKNLIFKYPLIYLSLCFHLNNTALDDSDNATSQPKNDSDSD